MFDRHDFSFSEHGRCGHRFARSPRDEDRWAEKAERFANRFGRHHGGGMGREELRGRRERMFDTGDIRLVILRLLAHQPGYGYQLIKTLEELMAGGYSPSAGVIYPTLTMLEEEGLITSSTENNKKVFRVTPEGEAYLEENKQRVDELFERMDEAGRGFERGRSPEIMRAFRNLRGAVLARVVRGNATAEQIQRITEIIDEAAKAVDQL